MVSISLFVLFLASAGGLLLGYRIWRGGMPDWPQSVAHALFGFVALILLVVGALTEQESSALLYSLTLAVLAALTGLYLVSAHLRQRLVARPALVIHGGLALLSLAFLFAI